MKHLDLFSGIGGFAEAVEMVWPGSEHVFCDNDAFSQAVLKKHYPNSLIYGDIRELTYQSKIDLITGGFPCQPFSAAGKRGGTEDDRHLWPEMLRVIRECHPMFVLGENVSGFLTWNGGLVFEQVCTDLEKEGYKVCAFVIPACSVGAPHRRERVWIAAYSNRNEHRGRNRSRSEADGVPQIDRSSVRAGRPGRTDISAADSKSRRQQGRKISVRQERPHQATTDIDRGSWDEEWPSVAARLCTVDDGLPNGLARPRGWRNAALKGAGNAIVPQVAAMILRAMRDSI